jgi:DNA-binding transcriptional LysR family regulator
MLHIHEHEPAEALGLLADDEADLALIYDYNLAPADFGRGLTIRLLGSTRWGLGVPSDPGRGRGTAPEVFSRFRDYDWIVNSRNTADDDVIRVLGSLAGFEPNVAHRADSLELVQDMIVAGLGVGLLPAGQPAMRGMTLQPLHHPQVMLRVFAAIRRGRPAWPPLALVLDLIQRGFPAPAALPVADQALPPERVRGSRATQRTHSFGIKGLLPDRCQCP